MTQNDIVTTRTMIDAGDLDQLARHAPATDDLLALADWLASNGSSHLSAMECIELAERLITRRRFLIGAGALGLGVITGCGPEEAANAPISANSRTVEGVLGNTYTLDGPPERLHADVDNVLALGATPISTELYGDSQFAPYQAAAGAASVEVVRYIEGPNFERIAALAPDFIMTSWGDQLYQRRLADIAPTMFINNSQPWREVLRHVAHPLFKDDEAERVISSLEQHFDDFKTRLAARQGQTPCLLYISSDGEFILQTKESKVGLLLTELGFAPMTTSGDVYGENVALESLVTESRGDFLLVLIDTWRLGDANEPVPAHVQAFLDSELAKRIPAAQGGTFILPVDGNNVYYLSPLSIPIFVDQLEELLS